MSDWLEQASKELQARDVVDAYYDALALLKQAEAQMIEAGLLKGKMKMAIYVMTMTSDGCPGSFYEFIDKNDGYYPWAFHGYVRMAATNDADAEQELLAAREEFWRSARSWGKLCLRQR